MKDKREYAKGNWRKVCKKSVIGKKEKERKDWIGHEIKNLYYMGSEKKKAIFRKNQTQKRNEERKGRYWKGKRRK